VLTHAAPTRDISYSQASLAALASHGGTSWWNEHRVRWVVAGLKAAGITELVEVGAGSGAMTARLAQEGVEIVAVEPLYEGASGIAALGHAAFCGVLADLALPDDAVPALGYFDVLEHLPDPRAELTEAFRVLQPGGILVVTVPSYQWLWSEEDVHAGHFRRYTKATLRELVEGAGLATVRVEYLFASLVVPALFTRRIPFLLGRNHGAEHRALAGQLDPPAMIGAMATGVLTAERAFARVIPLPFGLSTAGVFRKPPVTEPPR
jgi:SAM-dependent methyltransferase